MTCTTVLVVGGSLGYQYWQSRAADARVTRVQTLANSTISNMTEKRQHSSASVETQAALFQSALRYLEQLRRTSGNDPRLLLELSKAYGRVGDLQGSPLVAANLGNPTAAIQSYKKAADVALESHVRLPLDESTQAAMEAYQSLGEIQSSLGNSQEARDSYRHALSLAIGLWREKPEDPDRKRPVVMNYSGLGYLEWADLEPDKALKNFRLALETFGDDPNGNKDHDRTLIRMHWLLGIALNEFGSQSGAIANLEKSAASILLREKAGDVGILIDGVEGWSASGLPLEIPDSK